MLTHGWVRLAVGLLVLAAAAVLEVAGDAVIRRGLWGRSIALTALGFLVLGSYGIVVNFLRQDFSRTLGTYAGLFAVASVLAGRVLFGERIPASSWLGLGVILTGCLIIQYGSAPR